MGYALVMNIRDIRKSNYDRLLREFREMAERRGERFLLKDFAAHYELNENHATQMKLGYRRIGDEVSRRMERNHRPPLPEGWMDRDHEKDPADPIEQAAIDLFLQLYRDNPAEAYRLVSKMVEQKNKKK